MDKDRWLKVERAFESIPTARIISTAKKVQGLILRKEEAISLKSGDQEVTAADICIQEILLSHFATALAGLNYEVISEEAHTHKAVSEEKLVGSLIIDPLDGTSAFARGADEWGVMVGWLDCDGILQISWNLCSDGSTYSSLGLESDLNSVCSEWSYHATYLRVDVYDYKSGAADRFAAIAAEKIPTPEWEGKIQVFSAPASIEAGRRLFTGELDGLLWLPSLKGKKYYPDYDLIMLGALKHKGWVIRVASLQDGGTVSVVVASSKQLATLLEECGKVLASPEFTDLVYRDYV